MARRAAIAAVTLLILAAAAPAQAGSVTVDCDTLQDGLDQVQSGDVITLQGICTESYQLHTFPTPMGIQSYSTWTLRGIPGDGADGFDGSALTGAQRMLTGVDVHRLEIQNLLFRDGDVTGDGGALDITGESSIGLRFSSFFNNSATGKGGAVHLSQDPPAIGITLGGIGVSDVVFGSATDPAEGNSAATGGALSIESPGQGNNNSGVNGSTFANNVATGNGGGLSYAIPPASAENFSLNGNTFVDNKAGGSGGGGHVVAANTLLQIDNETYEGNSVEPVPGYPAGDHFGGGLYVEGGTPNLRNNLFRGNSIEAFPDNGDYGGGGLAIRGTNLHVTSQYTRVQGNTVAGHTIGLSFESEGGGLFFEGNGGHWESFLDMVAGNSIGDGGEGGGIYVGGVSPTALDLAETTVSDNTVGTAGAFPGIAGDPEDDLTMWNSIVYTAGGGDIGGFDFFDVRYSDACHGQGGAFNGPGNICADPRLVGGTDVHQTKQSPTIDKGSDELYNSVGGERNPEDFEGDPRPTDGDGDGHTVDMGADETPAGFIAPPVVTPAAKPQCSDGRDNDADGAVDLADPGCLAGPLDDNEGDETERDLFLCGTKKISLVRADAKRGKVVLSGLVAASAARKKIELSVRYVGLRGKPVNLGSVRAKADGSFRARVKRPPRKLFILARYRAKVGRARSVELKLPQSLVSTSIRRVRTSVGTMLFLRGRVDRALLGKKPKPVVVRRILCGRYRLVGRAKPNARGVYVVRFLAPPRGGAALYRAESKVLARPGSKRYVKQFARAIGITF
jgi:hypothetical protein